MLEWKKSLASFDNDVADMLADYVNSKLMQLSLNESGRANIAELTKKFSADKILDGIEEAAKKYLKYNGEGVDKESAEVFLKKIGGVITVKELPPTKQKLAYIKGICRNRFEYWNDRTGAIILNNYVNALENHGYSDERIAQDLEDEVIPLTKESNNWSQWKNTLEGWTEQINKWEKPNSKNSQRESLYQRIDISLDHLERIASINQDNIRDKLAAILHIGTIFPLFDEQVFGNDIKVKISLFISKLEELYSAIPGKEIDEAKDFVRDFVEASELSEHFEVSDKETMGVEIVFYEKIQNFLEDLFSELYLPRTLYKRKDIDILLRVYRKYYP